ncbi:hypothetical protein ACLOJK_027372 [Asimina triloba]
MDLPETPRLNRKKGQLLDPTIIGDPASSRLAQHCGKGPLSSRALASVSSHANRLGVPEGPFSEDGAGLKAPP